MQSMKKTVFITVFLFIGVCFIQAQVFDKYGCRISQKPGGTSEKTFRFRNTGILPVRNVIMEADTLSDIDVVFLNPETFSLEPGEFMNVKVKISNKFNSLMKGKELNLEISAIDNNGYQLDSYMITLIVEPLYFLWLIIISAAVILLAVIYILIYRKFS